MFLTIKYILLFGNLEQEICSTKKFVPLFSRGGGGNIPRNPRNITPWGANFPRYSTLYVQTTDLNYWIKHPFEFSDPILKPEYL